MNNSVNKKGDCKLGKQIKILKQVSYKHFFLRIQYPLRTLAHMWKLQKIN
jgi:hypothetical protein